MPYKAIFLDRDGTLCEDTGYINNINDLHIFSETDSLQMLKDRGFSLIGITNQSGIARGLIREDFVQQVNTIFMNKYGFDDFYYCPHHADERCACRKPEPEMLLRARSKHRIDFRRSYVIGDKDSDMLLAQAVGAKGILVKTGKLQDSQYAEFTAANLAEAANWILKDSK